MSITQSFYDNIASKYDRLFQDWTATTREQAEFLDGIFRENGFTLSDRVLDCACGIGTQAIGLAALGYDMTASDFSEGALTEAKKRAESMGMKLNFAQADFRALEERFEERFDIVIAMDNALPHMLTKADLAKAIESIAGRVAEGGMLVASIRDYDALLDTRPPYSPPYIHETEKGQRVSFQTWHWEGENYRLIQYIIEDEQDLQISRFECEYRATRRNEMSDLLAKAGFGEIKWLMPEDCGFYQPVVIAKK